MNKIIMADDDRNFLEYMTEVIKTAVPGVHIDTAADGRELVNRVVADHYTLVLTDYNMPRMNGLDAVKYIRSRPEDRHQKVPIYVIAAKNVRNESENVGATGFFQKPLMPDDEDFLLVLDKHLSN